MARIPADELARIKRDVSVLDLMRRQGYQLKAHGGDRVMACPFHDDDTPSLVVTPEKNLWHCMGACQTGGSVIDWVMKTEGISFRHAVELLRGDLSTFSRSVTERGKKPVKVGTTPKLETFSAEDGQALMVQVIDYYHQRLKESDAALAYLESRGLNDPELIDRFKLGYADRTLGYHLPQKNRKAGKEVRGQLQELGILRKTGHEHFNGSLVVPILDRDQITEIYGRKIRDDLKASIPRHLYLPGPHRGVFNQEGLQEQSEVILCESLIDALTFWRARFKNVTTAYGTSGFTGDILEALKTCGADRVLIAFDRDGAGDKAAEKVAAKLANVGLESCRVQFPKGMDANEFALKVAPADKSLDLVVRKAFFMKAGEAVDADESPEPKSQLEPDLPLVAEPIVEPTPESEAPPAQAVPAESETIAADVTDKEVRITQGDRDYVIRGLAKNQSYEQLKVTVLASRGDDLHVDTLDLYHAKARGAFVRQAGIELCVEERVIKRDLGMVLRKLEELQTQQIETTLEPATPAMSEDEEADALELLRDPNLLDRLVDDLAACGLVGETVNKQVAYLAAVSRKLTSPLAIIVQSTSAAGKSALMDAVLNLTPEEDRVHYSAMTGQSLFYMGEGNLKHKVLAIAEEEGVRQAAYALKLLQSQGELTIASTGKDPNTGKLITEEYRVQGPVMLFLTTTAVDIDEELMNRCLVLTVDESRDQTRRIHALQRQRRTLAGLKTQQQREHLVKLHTNAQRLLRPLAVVNPFADQLTFVDDRTRTRRDHEKYLTMIDAVALLHQHQRPIKTASWRGEAIEYVEVTLEDIERVNALAHEVLGRSLDELPPQTRRLLGKIQGHVQDACRRQGIEQSDYRFSRRQLREVVGLSDTQLRVHLERLVELEYLLVHRGGRGQSFVYELLFDGDLTTPNPQLMGLIQPDLLAESVTTNPTSRGSEPGFARSTRPQNGAIAVGSRGSESALSDGKASVNGHHPDKPLKNGPLRTTTPVVRTSIQP